LDRIPRYGDFWKALRGPSLAFGAGLLLLVIWSTPHCSLSAQISTPEVSAQPYDLDSLVLRRVGEDSTLTGTGPWPERRVTNWAFGVGETLSYSIGWEKIVAGHGQMIVGDVIDSAGHLCYPIESHVRSTSFISTFYKVDDRITTLLDARQLYPLEYNKSIAEGRYRKNRHVSFDPERGLAVSGDDTLAMPPYVHDDLSLLYFVRTMDLVPGQDIELDIYGGKKLYRLTVKIVRKERIRVEAGMFSTIVVEPLLQAAGLFKHEGRVRVWLTDDRLHLPVLMKSKVVVGSIVAELEDYRLGRIRRY
jgi:hypothetical protein